MSTTASKVKSEHALVARLAQCFSASATSQRAPSVPLHCLALQRGCPRSPQRYRFLQRAQLQASTFVSAFRTRPAEGAYRRAASRATTPRQWSYQNGLSMMRLCDDLTNEMLSSQHVVILRRYTNMVCLRYLMSSSSLNEVLLPEQSRIWSGLHVQ